MNIAASRIRWLLTVIACLTANIAGQAAQFNVRVGTDTKSTGTSVTIPIVVATESPAGAAQMEVVYDATRLRWVSGTAGPLTANSISDSNLISPGRVKIAFAGGEDVKGTGTIYLATFEWISPGGPSAIQLTGVRAWDQATGLEMSVSASPGEVSPAAEPAAPPAAPTPPTPPLNYTPYVIGFALALILAIVVFRSRKSAGK